MRRTVVWLLMGSLAGALAGATIVGGAYGTLVFLTILSPGDDDECGPLFVILFPFLIVIFGLLYTAMGAIAGMVIGLSVAGAARCCCTFLA